MNDDSSGLKPLFDSLVVLYGDVLRKYEDPEQIDPRVLKEIRELLRDHKELLHTDLAMREAVRHGLDLDKLDVGEMDNGDFRLVAGD